ncbi:hypothetical protein ACFQMF_03200 [Halorubrum rutilum]|uniref:PD(D/E)XK endonuclease domain-containing protein n=1 Tax=Halorubrum rutilum TaxID=1364933 RepID=A0ABD6AHR1_9EURY|nr:hypothetical protein [Halorubrum rutilum]
MPVSVEVTPRYVRRARQISQERMGSFEDNDEWYSDAGEQGWGHEAHKRHFIGALGEMAFAIYYDLQVDTETFSRTDGGSDFRVRFAERDASDETVEVDVKCSPAENPDLIVETDSVDADYYVQCRLPHGPPENDERTTVEMLGGATKEMLLNREPRRSLKYGHYNYHVGPEYLLELPPPGAVQPIE